MNTDLFDEAINRLSYYSIIQAVILFQKHTKTQNIILTSIQGKILPHHCYREGVQLLIPKQIPEKIGDGIDLKGNQYVINDEMRYVGKFDNFDIWACNETSELNNGYSLNNYQSMEYLGMNDIELNYIEICVVEVGVYDN